MKLAITPSAVKWYKEELGLNPGDAIRLFVRYGGFCSAISGFSLGITKGKPKDPAVRVTQDGITFFIEKDDLWYFQDHDLTIDYDPKSKGAEFILHEPLPAVVGK